MSTTPLRTPYVLPTIHHAITSLPDALNVAKTKFTVPLMPLINCLYLH